MRLLQRQGDASITRTDNYVVNIPPYTILSHTWGADNDEVSFDDFTAADDGDKAGYRKIQFCARQAQSDGIQHFWIDTCCINKANHTELSEAIASMFRWYQNAEKCYVYLSDVSARADGEAGWDSTFCRSRWFTRGWTLQELLAPRCVEFFSREGNFLGDKTSLEHLIREATNIPAEALRGVRLTRFSVEERMSWASTRRTTRKEDEAYCLQGIFGVFIPLIYGEEKNAFIRLQRAIDERYSEEQENPDMAGRPSKRRKFTNGPETSDDPDKLILQSLAFPEMHNRRLNVEPRHQHTCEWILDTAEYKQWMSGSQGLFWVKGKPGAGKSTVMAFLHNELNCNMKQNSQELSSIQLDFFFSARGTELQRTFPGMLRSLLHQLFLQDIPTSDRLRLIFSDKQRSFGNSPTNWAWQLSELKLLFADSVVAAGQHRSLLIFVDALDEAGEQSARQIAQYFHQINEQSAHVRASIKICISCRHYPIVTSKKINLEVSVENHNENDIASFIRDTLCLDQVAGDNSAEKSIWQALGSELSARAQGVFQWVHLVIPLVQRRIDRGESPIWIRQRLQDVPKELRDVYVHILHNVIDKEDRPLSFLLFQWVTLAARPLSITEMRHALTTTDQNETCQSATNGKSYDVINNDKRMMMRIKPLSGGLLEVVSDGDDYEKYVQVGHQSVNDFMLVEGLALSELLSNNAYAITSSSVSPSNAHEFIPRCQSRLYKTCLQYLVAVDVFKKEVSEGHLSYTERERLMQKSPLFSYAILRVFYHAKKAGQYRTGNLSEEVIVLQRFVPWWTEWYDVLNYFGSPSPSKGSCLLHVASQMNMLDIVEYLLQSGCDVHLRDGLGQTALHVSAKFGHQNSALLLSKFGVDVNVLDHVGRTALVNATEQGQVPMVRWLLDQGAHIAATGKSHGDALYAAASSGHVELVKLFIMVRSAANNLQGNEALRIASLRGHEEVVQMLLDAKAQLNITPCNCSKALQAASSLGHESIVHKLLEAGADVNSQGTYYGTPLQAASLSGHEEIIQILLDSGADVNMQVGRQGTALHAASIGGRYWIVRKLLERGADVNIRGGDYDTVLQAASIGGYHNLVVVFLDRGAEVNTVGGRYGTALQAAAFGGRLTIVQELLRSGADVSIQGGFFGNALRAAVVGGHEEILCTLVAASSVHQPLGQNGSPMRFKHLF